MARQDVLMEPQSPGSPASPDKPSAPELPEPYSEMRSLDEDAAVKPDRRTSSSSSSSSRASSAECVFHVDASEMHTPLVVAAAEGDDDHADAGTAAEAKLPAGDWVSWPEPSSDGGTVSAAPEAQTMAKPAVEGFNPDRIPASVFQPKAGSQADWSITSNESLFSIHGASLSTSDDFYAPSRSHFDYFYDEAMAAGGGGFQDGKLPPLAEVPGSAMSDASEGSASAKRGIRRHESGSIGSSSNFSFAFPILAEPSPGTKESMGGYQQLQKEQEQSPPTPSNRKSQFEEMTTEEERRPPNTGWCWCGECCGCCWFACSWPTCCCQWRWRCCSCSCSWPTCCQCSWCL
ncbi:uncharacterized protein LOC123441458 [Hordeum vulgare subsp. vulgare]|uniref:uncharacterized protein LOC123441458 n=1 Tax=Hordeum vulgare subsp. vulgare TaxID=112509 RepID=UPI001D1A4FDF|nr:uncharacterized protein LOC123441458 [Hordeum vulgare subsp. vulgare]